MYWWPITSTLFFSFFLAFHLMLFVLLLWIRISDGFAEKSPAYESVEDLPLGPPSEFDPEEKISKSFSEESSSHANQDSDSDATVHFLEPHAYSDLSTISESSPLISPIKPSRPDVGERSSSESSITSLCSSSNLEEPSDGNFLLQASD
eukprot:Sdes_comp10376_c0_seq2m2031